MTILDARDIAPEKARSLFDVTLGEFLVLAECAKAITNNHGCSPTRNTCKRVYCPLDKYPRYVFMSTVEESCPPPVFGRSRGVFMRPLVSMRLSRSLAKFIRGR